jgi:hypothetical protein
MASNHGRNHERLRHDEPRTIWEYFPRHKQVCNKCAAGWCNFRVDVGPSPEGAKVSAKARIAFQLALVIIQETLWDSPRVPVTPQRHSFQGFCTADLPNTS